MMKTTQELLELMKKTPDFDRYMDTIRGELVETDIASSLTSLLDRKNMSKSQCIKASGLDRTYAYQIFSGEKIPSRDKVLTLCLGMGLTLEEVQTLLKYTKYPVLYPRTERDCAIIYAFQNSLCVTDTNELLFEMNFELLV